LTVAAARPVRFTIRPGRLIIPLVRFTVPACALLLPACGPGGSALHMRGATMGTYYAVTVANPPAAVDESRLRAELEQILARINAQMSTYDADSEISRFNRHRATDWRPVSPQLAQVTAAALALAEQSGGVFDVTVGPLVQLWGFGSGADSTAQNQPPPPAAAIEAARARVGHRKLRARTAPPALRKLHPELSLDLSAIAKGHAVDALAGHLAGRGLGDFLVDIGGEIRTRGANPAGRPWRVAVERPRRGARAVHTVLTPGDNAVATSGDYRNFRERDGRRWSHIIDPRNGRPVEHATASVTVVAADAMTADGLATALLVLGAAAGLRFAREHGVAAYFIRRNSFGSGFSASASPAFALYLSPDNPDAGLASTPFGP